LPALLTLLVVAISRDSPSDALGPRRIRGVELLPAPVTRTLDAAAFGPPIQEVTSATTALQLTDGWVVLDRRSQQLVFLDASVRLRKRAVGAGAGPGELDGAASLALLGSRLAVLDTNGWRLDLFSTDGDHVERVVLSVPECGSAPVGKVVGGAASLILLRRCLKRDGSTTALIERLDGAGRRDVVEERAYGDVRSGRFDLLRAPLLAGVEGRLYLAIAPERCADLVGDGADPSAGVCYPEMETPPLPDSVREQMQALAPRMRALGLTVETAERYPPFTDLLEVGGHLAFEVPLVEGGRAIDVVRGDALERILLPDGAQVFFGRDEVLIARDLLEGTAFAVLPLP
jgi:hypothetical protein